MKKIIAVLSVLLIVPTMASACTYKNIKVKNGEVVGKWIPCNDENCADYQRHKRMIENQNVQVHDINPSKGYNRDM